LTFRIKDLIHFKKENAVGVWNYLYDIIDDLLREENTSYEENVSQLS